MYVKLAKCQPGLVAQLERDQTSNLMNVGSNPTQLRSLRVTAC